MTRAQPTSQSGETRDPAVSAATLHGPGAVPALQVAGLRKEYYGRPVVKDVDLSVSEGEFLTLLGPSGSGKTTILLMIAGFVQPDAGVIQIGGKPATYTQPHKRNIGVVFQNYALFPHMTVSENLAFPLRMRGLSGTDIRRRISEMLDLVALQTCAERRPAELSGGQQQRVALARALIFNPAVVLLDEPLSALDRKLRERLQLEVRQLLRKMNATAILVTHDQQEALTMSDRIAVLNAGTVLQCDRPQAVYERPADLFVADFMGDSNFMKGQVGSLSADAVAVHDPEFGTFRICRDREFHVGEQVFVVVRPERMRLSERRSHPARNDFPCRVSDVVYCGSTVRYDVHCGNRAFVVRVQSGAADAVPLTRGSEAFLSWPPEAATPVQNGPHHGVTSPP